MNFLLLLQTGDDDAFAPIREALLLLPKFFSAVVIAAFVLIVFYVLFAMITQSERLKAIKNSEEGTQWKTRD